MASTKRYTAEDLLEMDDDGSQYELIDGELLSAPPANMEHSRIAFRLGGRLWEYERLHPEMHWITGDPGFLLARDPDVLLAPDLATIRSDRLPEDLSQQTYFDIAP